MRLSEQERRFLELVTEGCAEDTALSLAGWDVGLSEAWTQVMARYGASTRAQAVTSWLRREVFEACQSAGRDPALKMFDLISGLSVGGHALLDSDQSLLAANPAFLQAFRITNWSPGTKDWARSLPAGSRAAVQEAWGSLWSGEASGIWMELASGEVGQRWLTSRRVPLPCGQTVLLLSVGVGGRELAGWTDGTLAQIGLIALEAADAGVWEWSLATRKARWTRHGIGGGDLQGWRGWEEFLPHVTEGAGELSSAFQALTDGSAVEVDVTYSVATPEGRRWFRDRGRVVNWGVGGKASRVAGLSEDVTEQAEKELASAADRKLIEALPQMVTSGIMVVKVLDGRLLYDNGTAGALLGLSGGALSIRTLLRRMDPADRRPAWGVLRRFLSGEVEQVRDLWVRFPEVGIESTVLLDLSRYAEDEEGRLTEVFATVKDVGRLAAAREALAGSEERFAAFADLCPDCIYIFDLVERRNLFCNKSTFSILGYSPEEIQGMGSAFITTVIHPDDLSQIAEADHLLRDLPDGADRVLEYRIFRPDGDIVHIRSKERVFKRAPDGTPTQILGFAQDISSEILERDRLEEYVIESHEARLELETLNDELHSMSQRDGLTGVGNRRALEERFTAWAQAGDPFGLVIADIDRFKAFNDTHGHLAGDAVLQGVASTLATHSRSGDFVGRYGGEEFVVLVRSGAPVVLREVAERYRTAVESSDYGYGPVTSSFGVTAWLPGEDWGQVVARADAALYAAKEGGRNRVVWEEPGVDLSRLDGAGSGLQETS